MRLSCSIWRLSQCHAQSRLHEMFVNTLRVQSSLHLEQCAQTFPRIVRPYASQSARRLHTTRPNQHAPVPHSPSPQEPGRTESSRESEGGKPPNGHVLFYREIVPAMIPIFLLGSGVYLVSRHGYMDIGLVSDFDYLT